MIRSMLLQAQSTERRPAVFLDRDGTLTECRGFITQPSQLSLIDGVTDALDRLSAFFACVVVTNQSAVGRGLISNGELDAIHCELAELLAGEEGTPLIAAIYDCPETPTRDDSELHCSSPDRKPGPGMLQQAALDLNLDLSRSWMIGDRVSDVLAGINAGCLGSIRVESGFKYEDGPPVIDADYISEPLLSDAVDLILRYEEQGVHDARSQTIVK